MDILDIQNDTGAQLKQLMTMRISATEMEVRAAISTIRTTLTEFGLASDHLTDIEIVLAEVFNNIVEHAYSQTGAGQIHVTCDLSGQTLSFCVRDSGKGFQDGAPPAGEMPDLTSPVSSLPEGGFGWMMIRELTNTLDYQRTAYENILTFSFSVNR